MIKKGSILLLALLVGLPGCGRKNKKMDYSRINQTDEFNTVNLALAHQGDLEIDESTRSFFDGMEEFVSFAQDGNEFDLVQAQGDAGVKNDEFAWQSVDEAKQFETVYFGFDKDKVDKLEREKVARNIEKTKQIVTDAKSAKNKVKVVVEGHACDSAGSDTYNMALSERRAKEISDQLVAAGISRDDVKVVGRGSEMLVVKEGNREEQWPNRRVELHVIQS
jgi:outer membrane protein OmpA-like peptidoglycan-associated protein